jgi:hypothetical protein
MVEKNIERFFCNKCKNKTKHFIQGEFEKHDDYGEVWYKQRMLIVECCGCENLALIKSTLFSEDIEYSENPITGETESEGIWEEFIYPPVTYRTPLRGLTIFPTEHSEQYRRKSISLCRPSRIT